MQHYPEAPRFTKKKKNPTILGSIKCKLNYYSNQGFVKGEVFCFRYPDFYFLHGESASTASQISKDLNKVPLLLQNLGSVK